MEDGNKPLSCKNHLSRKRQFLQINTAGVNNNWKKMCQYEVRATICPTPKDLEDVISGFSCLEARSVKNVGQTWHPQTNVTILLLSWLPHSSWTLFRYESDTQWTYINSQNRLDPVKPTPSGHCLDEHRRRRSKCYHGKPTSASNCRRSGGLVYCQRKITTSSWKGRQFFSGK